eukprot:UN24863
MQMYLHFGVHYDPTISMMKRPKKYRPLEKIFNWITYVYEQSCCLVGLSSRFGSSVCSFYKPDHLMKRAFFNIDNITFTHFRWLLHKFCIHFARELPESEYQRLLQPMLLPIFISSFT